MKSLCSLNMNSTKLSADTYEDLKVIPFFPPSFLPSFASAKVLRQKGLVRTDFVASVTRK